MKIISRQEAIELGLKRYFTGKPCKKGHVAERWASSVACLECQKQRQATPWKKEWKKQWMAEWRAKPENKEREKQYQSEYHAKPENKEREKERRARPENKERRNESIFVRRILDPDFAEWERKKGRVNYQKKKAAERAKEDKKFIEEITQELEHPNQPKPNQNDQTTD